MIARIAHWLARRILHDLPRVGICLRCGAVRVCQDDRCSRCWHNNGVTRAGNGSEAQ